MPVTDRRGAGVCHVVRVGHGGRCGRSLAAVRRTVQRSGDRRDRSDHCRRRCAEPGWDQPRLTSAAGLTHGVVLASCYIPSRASGLTSYEKKAWCDRDGAHRYALKWSLTRPRNILNSPVARLPCSRQKRLSAEPDRDRLRPDIPLRGACGSSGLIVARFGRVGPSQILGLGLVAVGGQAPAVVDVATDVDCQYAFVARPKDAAAVRCDGESHAGHPHRVVRRADVVG